MMTEEAVSCPEAIATAPAVSTRRTGPSLNIFVLHPSHFLTDHRPHGDGLLAFEFLRRLANRGHNVHVAVSMQSIQSKLPANLHLYDIQTRFRASIDGGGPLNRVEFSWRAGALFRQLSRTIHFDVVHQFNPVLYGLCFFANIGNTPLVMGPIPPPWPRGTVHPNTFKRRLMDSIRTPLLKFQYLFAQSILPASPMLLEHPAIRRLPPGKASVLTYGIDPETFCPGDPDRLPERPTILFLANIWFGKGIFTLLDAFAAVHQAMPQARLIIAGRGTDQEKVRQLLLTHPAKDAIQMIGNVERANVPAVLCDCTLYCLPSFGEPFGMTALEAMSCGRATITTNTGGLAWLAPDDGTIRISPGDVPALTQALLRVLSNPSLAEKMGRRNREHVLENYAWDVILSRLEGIYDKVRLNKKRIAEGDPSRCAQPV